MLNIFSKKSEDTKAEDPKIECTEEIEQFVAETVRKLAKFDITNRRAILMSMLITDHVLWYGKSEDKKLLSAISASINRTRYQLKKELNYGR